MVPWSPHSPVERQLIDELEGKVRDRSVETIVPFADVQRSLKDNGGNESHSAPCRLGNAQI